MKRLVLPFALFALSCSSAPVCKSLPSAGGQVPRPPGLPKYDHVVIVIEENKDYEQIIGSADAPYINKLKAEGASFVQMYGEEHNSQGNYFWLFSGSDQDLGFYNSIPKKKLAASNLGGQLIETKVFSFKGFSQGLPKNDPEAKKKGAYARKHVPWISFGDVPSTSNVSFDDFPQGDDYTSLPTMSFVIPDLDHDMHNGKAPKSIQDADRWLKEHLDRYYQWAKNNKSLLIVTFDENDHGFAAAGLTDPAASRGVARNRIATVFAGARIRHGSYAEGDGITHVNILRTLESMYGLKKSGAQQCLAAKAGIRDDFIITDVFEPAP